MTTTQSPPRVAGVDALRGLALFGMLVVHVQYYAGGPPVWADRVQTFIDGFFTERFWALFAFLFGVGFALQIERRGEQPDRRFLLTAAIVGLLLGQAANFIPSSWMVWPGEPVRLQGARIGLTFTVLNPMFQGLAYGAVLLLWIARAPEFPRLCAWLANAGRMSLTNYVVQICALELLFQGFGFTITRPMGLVFALAFFAGQILYGKWWFGRYRIGPLEWLWRSLTYGEPQRLRPVAPPLMRV